MGFPVSFLSHPVVLLFRRRSSSSIGLGERQQSSGLRGVVEDRNERIQWGKRRRLLINTDIVFFSLSLFKLSFSFSLNNKKDYKTRGKLRS